MASVKLFKYLFVHEPTEVMITVLASARPQARTRVDKVMDRVQEAGLTFPEGSWKFLGLAKEEYGKEEY